MVRYAAVVHSVDSLRLVDALVDAAVAGRARPPLDVLVQVSLDGDAAPRRRGHRTRSEQVGRSRRGGPAALRLKG